MSKTIPAHKPDLLIVDDNERLLRALERALAKEYVVRTANSKEAALEQVSPPPDAVLLDVRLNEGEPDNRDGVELLENLRLQFPELPVIMATAYGDIKTAVQCMQLGAADFIDKSNDNLVAVVESRVRLALRNSNLSRLAKQASRRLDLIEPREIVGESSQLREVKQAIAAVAQDGRITVLIRGETGTGKELVARAIHASGVRASGPFVAAPVAGLPAQLIESELFGSTAGAYTGAREKKIGYLETAHRGVLFLDEIGEVDAQIQSKLLRFLQEREFQLLGSTKAVKVDVQIVAATNSDLEAGVREGRFRKDLYYRLRGHEIVIPPLRERRDDIPLLVDHFLKLHARRGERVAGISPPAFDLLMRQDWPGNIRQLATAIESSLINAKIKGHQQIELEDLPRTDLDTAPQTVVGDTEVGHPGFSIQEKLARVELSFIRDAIRKAHGKKVEAWKLLGYNNRRKLYRRLRVLSQTYPQLVKEFEDTGSKTARRH